MMLTIALIQVAGWLTFMVVAAVLTAREDSDR